MRTVWCDKCDFPSFERLSGNIKADVLIIGSRFDNDSKVINNPSKKNLS